MRNTRFVLFFATAVGGLLIDFRVLAGPLDAPIHIGVPLNLEGWFALGVTALLVVR